MDWHDQKWSSVGFIIGYAVCLIWRDTTGFLVAWAATIITTAIGG